MQPERYEEPVVGSIRQLLEEAAGRLAAGGARDEALAALVTPRRVLFVQRKPAMVPLARVWRLGVFLLDGKGTLYKTGAIIRAVKPGHPGYQSVSAEHRRAHRAAAFNGPFPEGETVNYDAVEIPLHADALRSSPGPLFLDGDRAMVRWNTTGGTPVELRSYLDDRVNSLVHPPEGA